MILAILIIIHMLTMMVVWRIYLTALRKKQEKVTVADVLKETPFPMYIPFVNTVSLVAATIIYFVWYTCGVNKIFEKIWNKLNEIDL